jgi:hypothetical protein
MSDEIDVDSLLNEIEAPGDGIPMSANEEPATAAQPAPTQFDFGQFEFDWNGQKVRPDSFDKAKTWMQQGYNYSQRAADLNKKQTEFDQRTKHYSRFDEVDKYVKENPQWWDHVEQAWNTRDQQGQPQLDPSLEPIIKPLVDKVNQFESLFGQIQQERQQEVIAKEDQALDAEIESIRKLYPNIDFNAVDDVGRTLEMRILGHAQEIGTNSFRAATRDYLHDKLVETAKADSLTSQAKGKQIQTKQGILGVSSTPKKVIERAQNVRGKSYDSLAEDALRELGIG